MTTGADATLQEREQDTELSLQARRDQIRARLLRLRGRNFAPQRTLWHTDRPDDAAQGFGTPVQVTHSDLANLVSSHTTDDLHAPILDFAVPVRAVPSSTIGHYHLYIEQELSWEHYRLLLDTLVTVGLCSPAYRDATVAAEQSLVRRNVYNSETRHRLLELSDQVRAALTRQGELQQLIDDKNEQVLALDREVRQLRADLAGDTQLTWS